MTKIKLPLTVNDVRVKIDFGQYYKKSIQWIMEHDPEYLEWIMYDKKLSKRIIFPPVIRDTIREWYYLHK